jgi:hypothetical protein
MIAHTACKISDKCSKTMASKPIVVCIHFLKPHLPKMCDRHSLCYRLGSLGRWRFHEGKKKTLILESNINLTTACSQYQDKWICDETLYRLSNAHYPHLKNTFVFTREALNRVLSAKAGPCIAPYEVDYDHIVHKPNLKSLANPLALRWDYERR